MFNAIRHGEGGGGGIRDFDKMINLQRIPKNLSKFFWINFFKKNLYLGFRDQKGGWGGG